MVEERGAGGAGGVGKPLHSPVTGGFFPPPSRCGPGPPLISPSQQTQTIPSMEDPAGSRAQAEPHMAHHVGHMCVTLRSCLGSTSPHRRIPFSPVLSSPQNPLLTLVFEAAPSSSRPKGRCPCGMIWTFCRWCFGKLWPW